MLPRVWKEAASEGGANTWLRVQSPTSAELTMPFVTSFSLQLFMHFITNTYSLPPPLYLFISLMLPHI